MAVRVRRLALALVVGGLLAGCTPVASAVTDGDLLDQWTAFPEPEPFVPEAGTCHTTYRPSVRLGIYQPIACDIPHDVETVYVGEFTGETADRLTPPAEGTPRMFNDCLELALDYLGVRASGLPVPIWTILGWPSKQDWDNGERTFRCTIYFDGTVTGLLEGGGGGRSAGGPRVTAPPAGDG